ncbi:MAG: hypothetical protein NT007_08670 [Candidatus Kapabacteria bacterium]|nr:hypothetical protein [Candidatus Kapabacteria bacterium]
MAKRIYFISILVQFLFLAVNSFSAVSFKSYDFKKDIEYEIRFTNGDILTGYYSEFISTSDTTTGDAIKFSTNFGKATIYENQVASIFLLNDAYRHNHRIFLMPTAEAIKSNHFVGVYEMLFGYLGVGIDKCISITAGRTLIPMISSKEQITVGDIKVTALTEHYDSGETMSLAVGANLTFLNHDNKLTHFYINGTYHGNKSIVTAIIFAKTGANDFNTLHFYGNYLNMIYENGSVGVGLGLDTKLSEWKGIRLIGELWNKSVLVPTDSGVLLGLRTCNTQLAADFGIAFFLQPMFIPFASFSWTPF